MFYLSNDDLGTYPISKSAGMSFPGYYMIFKYFKDEQNVAAFFYSTYPITLPSSITVTEVGGNTIDKSLTVGFIPISAASLTKSQWILGLYPGLVKGLQD